MKNFAFKIFLNLPFGETMAEQRNSTSFNNVFKFNGKELDTETGLYYYGTSEEARRQRSADYEKWKKINGQ